MHPVGFCFCDFGSNYHDRSKRQQRNAEKQQGVCMMLAEHFQGNDWTRNFHQLTATRNPGFFIWNENLEAIRFRSLDRRFFE